MLVSYVKAFHRVTVRWCRIRNVSDLGLMEMVWKYKGPSIYTNAKPYRMLVYKNIHTVRCTNISYLQQSFIYLEKVNFVLLHGAYYAAATPDTTRIHIYKGTYRYLYTKPVSNDKRVSGYQLCRENEPSRGCIFETMASELGMCCRLMVFAELL